MSLNSVLARIGEIQSRFGVSALASTHQVTAADFAGFDVDAVVELATTEAERLAGAAVASELEATLLEALAVHRDDARLGSASAVGALGGTSTSIPSVGGAPRGVFDGRVTFPVSGYSVGSAFGMRVDPIEGDHRMHRGVDIGAPEGTPIVAAGGGEVTWAGPRGSYGNLVVIRHDDRTETRYAHQSDVLVSAGERVAAGQIIGEVGSTGRSTGPHLHFEARVDGEAVDPVAWLREHGA